MNLDVAVNDAAAERYPDDALKAFAFQSGAFFVAPLLVAETRTQIIRDIAQFKEYVSQAPSTDPSVRMAALATLDQVMALVAGGSQ